MDIGNSKDFSNFFFLSVTAWKKVDRKTGEQRWYAKYSIEKVARKRKIARRICNKFTVREIKKF